MQEFDERLVSNILNQNKFENIQSIFSYLYSQTHLNGFNRKNWWWEYIEKPEDFNDKIAIICLPKPKHFDKKVFIWFTWEYKYLLEILKTEHLKLNQNLFSSIEEAIQYTNSIKEKSYIIVQNIVTNNFWLFEINPNGFTFEISNDDKKSKHNSWTTWVRNQTLEKINYVII